MDKQIRLGKFLKLLFSLAFLIPFVLYSKTLLPSLGYWDTGEFQTIPYSFDIGHPTGYPTYILIGKIYLTIFRLGQVAWRMNLLSAIFVSVGLFILSLLFFKISNRFILSLLITLLLAVNPYLWSIAIRADPHSLHFLFTCLFLFFGYKSLMEKSKLSTGVLAYITGLSLGNHMLSLFFLPSSLIILLYLSSKKTLKQKLNIFLTFLMFFLLGAYVYMLLPLISSFKKSFTVGYQIDSVHNFTRHVFGGDFQGLMGTWARDTFSKSMVFYQDIINKSFPFYLWAFAITGVILNLKGKITKYVIVTIPLFLAITIFSIKYQNSVIERYFVPTFTILSLWLLLFFNRLLDRRKYLLTYVSIFAYIIVTIFTLYNDNYQDIDQSKKNYVYDWATESLTAVKPNSVIFSWWSYSTPLWYKQRVENFRTDVTIINTGTNNWESEAEKIINKKDVYFIQEVELNNKNLKFEEAGNFYKLVQIFPDNQD